MPEISQQTLGYVCDALYALEPDAESSFEKQEFWKRTLFRAGFAPAFTEVAASYDFRWTDIIPALYIRKFGNRNQHFANLLPPFATESYLNQLVAFAVSQSADSPIGDKLRESLQADGSPISGQLQTTAAPELAKLPTKEILLKDLSSEIRDHPAVAVLFVDLDNFKSVNDQFGHSEGDKCLIDMVDAIGSVVCGKGKLYRCGGDEFCVLLPNFSTSEAHATAERIRSAIDAKPSVKGFVKVTASIGVASSDEQGLKNPQTLYDSADRAMYVSKWTGKNRVCDWPLSQEDAELADKNRGNMASRDLR